MLIGQAKGILMGHDDDRPGVPSAHPVSQDTNRKLRVVADELARTGQVIERKGSESSEATVYGLSQPSRTS